MPSVTSIALSASTVHHHLPSLRSHCNYVRGFNSSSNRQISWPTFCIKFHLSRYCHLLLNQHRELICRKWHFRASRFHNNYFSEEACPQTLTRGRDLRALKCYRHLFDSFPHILQISFLNKTITFLMYRKTYML